ncbi:ABC-F family ATP-binding cassette domain-containing protein [Aurantibacillus circumpalustris]|uniref:ABC-F family ATP-binding cassette domain-containing protein n=1 Tax=Aurantibacillus circumpalustris TaxID=3036359 RepID=UPI00295B6258|nr:ABC-F family ATP-binding cassette domain-containing protein [Aurantibacillus circumpalustris]
MISVNGVTVSFGGYDLFDNISFLINPKDRIGLAGKNGAGKSTLLKILSGNQNPTKGDISMPKTCKIGYLPQDMIHQHGRTVFEETESAFEEIQQLENRIIEINHQFETRTDYESKEYSQLIEEQTDVYTRLDMLGASNVHEEIEKILKGLGFDRKDFDRQTAEFSGGWRMRIELAKLLLQKPDVLLLDEPTNHLDIEAIMWLEEFMETFSGSVLLISHDKTFLDNVTNRTIEISNQKIYDYKTNYSRYLVLRKERREQQENAAKNQQKIIDQTEVLIDKYRAKASKAAFAQSLIKKLDRMERVEVDDDDTQSMNFRFPAPAHSGKIVLTVENAAKNYGPKHIFSGAEFIITKGEKIGLVGRNGEGKSTMMKMIAKKVDFDGKITLGHSVLMGYFEQDQEEKLDPKKTVFETIDEAAVGEVRRQVRGLLGSFLFRGDDIDKKVQVLSGGERGRLALCKLLLEPYNLLLMDEPTNHLDIRSKDILKRALIDYEGTVIMVSHDRDFMKGICDRLFEFREGKVKEYLCDIEEFMQIRKVERLNELDLDKTGRVQETVVQSAGSSKQVAASSEQKSNEAEQKQIRNQIKKSEETISSLEEKIKACDDKLANADEYEKLMNDKTFFADYEKLKKDLEAEMEKWEELSGKLL